MVALEVKLTTELASPAVACLVQARPRVAVPSLPWSRVQPGGVLTGPVIDAVDRNITSVSPACTVDGMVTVWVVRLPALLAAATNDRVAAGALLGGAGRVVVGGVVPARTVSVTVWLPAVA